MAASSFLAAFLRLCRPLRFEPIDHDDEHNLLVEEDGELRVSAPEVLKQFSAQEALSGSSLDKESLRTLMELGSAKNQAATEMLQLLVNQSLVKIGVSDLEAAVKTKTPLFLHMDLVEGEVSILIDLVEIR